MEWALLVLGAFLASLFLGFLVYPLLRRFGIIDRPNDRSSHERPTARGGGLAILGALAAAGTAALSLLGRLDPAVPPLMLATGGLAVVSFWDDIRPLPARVRFLAHGLAAVLALWVVGQPLWARALELAPACRPLWPLGLILGFLWLTGYTNAFNFMDGINGLAAGQAFITGLGAALLGLAAGAPWSSPPVCLSFLLAGAAAGFIPHNFPRARMFMGDVGSAPLGFLLAAAALWMAAAHGVVLLVPLLLLHANFVLDTAITLLRRVHRRERWHQAHREHFYQRLIRAGRSHSFVTGCEMLLQAVTVLLVLGCLQRGVFGRVLTAVAVLLGWGGFFLWCELQLRRSPLFWRNA
jgi:UDP-N-acetylmuramyl pentapeptide phosphotransferase/UDP-N-acetylglucosamine-1-phosphate transferase